MILNESPQYAGRHFRAISKELVGKSNFTMGINGKQCFSGCQIYIKAENGTLGIPTYDPFYLLKCILVYHIISYAVTVTVISVSLSSYFAQHNLDQRSVNKIIKGGLFKVLLSKQIRNHSIHVNRRVVVILGKAVYKDKL